MIVEIPEAKFTKLTPFENLCDKAISLFTILADIDRVWENFTDKEPTEVLAYLNGKLNALLDAISIMHYGQGNPCTLRIRMNSQKGDNFYEIYEELSKDRLYYKGA